jgi:hypothetical protein
MTIHLPEETTNPVPRPAAGRYCFTLDNLGVSRIFGEGFCLICVSGKEVKTLTYLVKNWLSSNQDFV